VTLEQATAHLFRRLSGVDAEALDVLVKTIVDLKRRRTLGGVPPAFNADEWRNRKLPDGPDPEYRGL
jgi:hypothetical protein